MQFLTSIGEPDDRYAFNAQALARTFVDPEIGPVPPPFLKESVAPSRACSTDRFSLAIPLNRFLWTKHCALDSILGLILPPKLKKYQCICPAFPTSSWA